jgi:hypothetical protein
MWSSPRRVGPKSISDRKYSRIRVMGTPVEPISISRTSASWAIVHGRPSAPRRDRSPRGGTDRQRHQRRERPVRCMRGSVPLAGDRGTVRKSAHKYRSETWHAGAVIRGHAVESVRRQHCREWDSSCLHPAQLLITVGEGSCGEVQFLPPYRARVRRTESVNSAAASARRSSLSLRRFTPQCIAWMASSPQSHEFSPLPGTGADLSGFTSAA